MAEKKGTLSITSENIFPIIKKWMYSDQDIFIRELISNGCDAITKLKKLEMMGEYSAPAAETGGDKDAMLKGRIDVECDNKGRTLTFIDNGIGMTAEEVDKYINQIAFSGATDFIEKYKDKSDSDQIIGHFGLGFYSAFMVADKVEIDSLSYAKDATPVHWECEGAGTDYTMTDGSRDRVGTKITLHISDDCLKYCNEYSVREVLDKYCSFMPQEIYLKTVDTEPEKAKDDSTDKDKKDEKKEEPKPINETMPLWAKTPSDCTDEEYKDFYRKVFHDYKEPLFWIHLNMDYPFNLKGILYFPKINIEYESAEGVIKLYNNQVFIADNIKEVIPEFLMLLKGVIDCPDLPLNVSRSALQNDGFVTKLSDYITKKVADKLSGMCKTEKEDYEKYWDDISPFIKYGCLRDDKFLEKMNDYILFKDLDGKYQTLPELLKSKEDETDEAKESKEETNDAEQAEETPKETVYYVTDELTQGQYIRMFKENGMNAVMLTHPIDQSFISQLEAGNEHYRFMRIDSDINGALKEEVSEDELKDFLEKLTETFKKALGKDDLKIEVEKAFYLPAPSLSLKAAAPALGFNWRQKDCGAMDSMVYFTNWLKTADKALLDKVLMYNEDDCKAMLYLEEQLKQAQVLLP